VASPDFQSDERVARAERLRDFIDAECAALQVNLSIYISHFIHSFAAIKLRR